MGINPFSSASAVIANRKAEYDSLVNSVATEAMRTAGHYVTAETPVKTGAARSNWVVTIGEPFEGILPPYYPYESLDHGPAPIERKDEASNRDAAREQHEVAYSRFDYRNVPVMFLRNNIEYVDLLNDGRSLQTERGFFERAAAAAREDVIGVWKMKA